MPNHAGSGKEAPCSFGSILKLRLAPAVLSAPCQLPLVRLFPHSAHSRSSKPQGRTESLIEGRAKPLFAFQTMDARDDRVTGRD